MWVWRKPGIKKVLATDRVHRIVITFWAVFGDLTPFSGFLRLPRKPPKPPKTVKSDEKRPFLGLHCQPFRYQWRVGGFWGRFWHFLALFGTFRPDPPKTEQYIYIYYGRSKSEGGSKTGPFENGGAFGDFGGGSCFWGFWISPKRPKSTHPPLVSKWPRMSLRQGSISDPFSSLLRVLGDFWGSRRNS